MLSAHPNEIAAAEAPRRRFRKLRIAWSVACGIACMLLTVLWVISRGRYSGIEGHVGKQSFSVISSLGQTNIYLFTTKAVPSPIPWRFSDSKLVAGEVVMPEHLGLQIFRSKAGLNIFVSYWVIVLLAAMGVLGPWLPWRFSLRTLLIAMTLIAVVLGIIVWMTRAG